MNAQGYSRKSICEVIGKDKSVLSRELRRNSDSRNRVYKSDLAQKKYEKRQLEKPKKQYFTSVIQEQAEAGLKSYLSLEQIVGLAKKKNDACVSVERIYQHVWTDKKKGGELHTYLRSKGKKPTFLLYLL